MLRGIIDTHAHYDEVCFANNLPDVLARQKRNGVAAIINCSSTVPSSAASVRLASSYDFIYAAVGILPGFNPIEMERLPADWLLTIERLAQEPKVTAIGEIGLDYFDRRADPKAQRMYFCQQLELASRLSLPVELHSREADEDMLAILRDYRPAGVMHRYSSSPEYAEKLLDIGLYLGIGCQVTYPDSGWLIDTVRGMPSNRLLLETDSPFLPPAQLAGQMSTSDMLPEAVEVIAQLRHCTAQHLTDLAAENALRLFPGIDRKDL